MKKKDIKLKSLLNESLGELPSSKLFKFNERTGKFESPEKRNKIIKEYLINSSSTVEDIEGLNLFADMDPDNLPSEYEDSFAESSKWKAVESKYGKIAKDLSKQLKPYYKLKVPKAFVNKLENSWYDGSDAYEDVELALDDLPKIYDTQAKIVVDLIKSLRSGVKEQSIKEALNDLNVHPWVARNMDELYKTLNMYINKNPKSIDFKSLKQLCTELVKQINQYHK